MNIVMMRMAALALAASAGVAWANAPDNKGAPFGTKPLPKFTPTGPIDWNKRLVIHPMLLRQLQLADVINGKIAYDDYFQDYVLPKAAFDAWRDNVAKNQGKAVRIVAAAPAGAWQADIIMLCDNSEIALRMVVDPAKPHRVTSLANIPFSQLQVTPQDIATAIAALPGKSGFGFFALGNGAPAMTAGYKSDQQLAIGSAFKLVVLAELVRAIDAHEKPFDVAKPWNVEVEIGKDELPPKMKYNASMAGTKVPLYDLAALMIQKSDNSATDLLMRFLGRDKVEAMLPVLGVAPTDLDHPWLTTLEVYKLKGIDKLADSYVQKSDQDQRAMLNGQVAGLTLASPDYSSARFPYNTVPAFIDRIEWFESPADIARAYDWLLAHSQPGMPTAAARDVLNGGVTSPQWAYVGYKGGSEAGVAADTWLLQGKDAKWYVLAGSWNNPAAKVDGALGGLLGRYASLVAPSAP